MTRPIGDIRRRAVRCAAAISLQCVWAVHNRRRQLQFEQQQASQAYALLQIQAAAEVQRQLQQHDLAAAGQAPEDEELPGQFTPNPAPLLH